MLHSYTGSKCCIKLVRITSNIHPLFQPQSPDMMDVSMHGKEDDQNGFHSELQLTSMMIYVNNSIRNRLPHQFYLFLLCVILADVVVITDCTADDYCTSPECDDDCSYTQRTGPLPDPDNPRCSWNFIFYYKMCQNYKYCPNTGECSADGSPYSVYCGSDSFKHCNQEPSQIIPSQSFSGHVDSSTSEFVSTYINPEKGTNLGAILSWPGSDLNLILYPPYGPKIQPSSNSSSVAHFKDATSEGYLIQNPLSGYWIIEAKPIEVGANG